MKPVLLIQGAEQIEDVPRLGELCEQAELRFATTTDELRAALSGAEAMLGWNFRADSLREAWDSATELRWIHWAGAGVDAAMFPELVDSDVQLTNARGIFDVPIAEWVLGMIICFAKQIPETLEFQAQAQWRHRLTEIVAGKRALVVGVGSIGRAIGRLLQAAGMEVEAIGRSARDGGADFSHIHAVDDLHAHLAGADYVVLITPLTEHTRNLFGATEFAAMASHARFINVGRGALVVEDALLKALNEQQIAGAALDVFVDEPLQPDSPFWSATNCLVSPHMSGDYIEYEAAMAKQFLDNWTRYAAGNPLNNIVDKKLGFVPGSAV
ncbi:MAG: D-2-hydroxyacid dehydrogenase [Gammaproteobacteria bacterium]|nr:D-2-hydroxyacid dehydrogenase [Gammaproteobacteria bacterium]